MSEADPLASPLTQYQQALVELRSGTFDHGRLVRRMSELLSLLDLTGAIAESRSNDEMLSAALLTAMGELQVSRGAVLVPAEDGCLEPSVSRGIRDVPRRLAVPAAAAAGPLRLAGAAGGEALAALGLELLCPIARAGQAVAFIALGPRAQGQGFGAGDLLLLRAIASCAATPLENSQVYDELTRLNRKLQAKLFQLENLFDLSRELTSSLDEEQIRNVVTTTLMGHLLASRCAFYAAREEGFRLIHQRGMRPSSVAPLLADAEVRAAFEGAPEAPALDALAPGRLKEQLLAQRMTHVVRIRGGGRDQGFFALGGRVPGASLQEEDADFAMTLGRLALAALDTLQLHRVRIQKERQDRELQIARGIQQSLFPQREPALEGFEIAARSESCYEVGGDYYDFLPLGDGRLGLAIADVSGKGTPASLLMASVHASLQALAGSAPPAVLIKRLNRFLYANTQANKFVTLFYGELDARRRRLLYVTAGHVPPFLVAADGSCRRLLAGGPALGLLDDAAFEQGEAELSPGDLLAVVTDGATEALSEADEEFGDERVSEALRGGRGARASLNALFAAVQGWAGARGCSDDLTALVLSAA